jgi:hypothetical protein
MRIIAVALAASLTGCAVSLDGVPRGGCLNWRSYSYRIPNPYRGGSLGEVSGTSSYVGARPSSEAEQSQLLLADPATHDDEKIAQRERTASHVLEAVSGGLLGIDVGPLVSGARRSWNEDYTISTATIGAVGIVGWGLSYAIIMASKRHAERARRMFNEEAAATGSCPPMH